MKKLQYYRIAVEGNKKDRFKFVDDDCIWLKFREALEACFIIRYTRHADAFVVKITIEKMRG